MKKRGMFFKQKMAALLALSMAVSSIPTGGLFTAVAAEREGQGGAELIRFDREKLREKAEKAAESKKMAAPPAVVASSSYALDFQSDSYELKDAGSLLEEGETLPEDTKLRIFLSPDEAGYEETEDGEIEYAMTGNESLVFMVENESDETRGYQLLFGNQITDVVTVKSRSQLLKEYETGFEEETATPSNAEETEAVKETLPAVTEETEAVKETLPAIPEETEAQPAESQEEAAGAPEETESAPETEPAESQEEEAQEPAESQEAIEIEMEDGAKEDHDSSVHLLGSLGRFLTGSIVAQAQELPATPSTAQPETGAAEEAQDKPQETTGAAEDATQETETPASQAEDASPSDAVMEENPEAERYIRLDRAVISDSVLIYSRQEKVDAPDEIKPMMLMNMDRTETEQAKPKKSNTRAVALVTVPYGELFAVGGTDNGIEVNLYNYSGKGHECKYINDYLVEEKINSEWSKDKNFEFVNSSTFPNEISAWKGKDGKVQNIYQGILNYSGKFGTDGAKLLETLFPDTNKTFKNTNNGIETHLGVDTSGLFESEDGVHYYYSSDDNSATYNPNTNQLVRGYNSDGGFWPFDPGEKADHDYFFGMSMKFDFYKPSDGKINNRDMVFNFSGDDDVWVFLTNEKGQRNLVLDMGGIHGDMASSINFATGEIIYSHGDGARPGDEAVQPVIKKGTADDNLIYNSENKTYSGNVSDICPELIDLTSSGTYTLEFYYMERGAGDSNCTLDFNLPVVPKQGITLAKQITADAESLEDYQNQDYTFNIISSSDKGEVEAAYRGEDSSVTSQEVILHGAEFKRLENMVALGDYFYIEEVSPGTDNVSWEVATSGSDAKALNGSVSSLKSKILQMPENGDHGFLITCTNQFGGLDPDISKKAVVRENGDGAGQGVYDITLSVTGDEITTAAGGEETKPLDVVVVVDKSASMEEYGFPEVKEKIKGFANLLDGTCKMKVIAFGNDRTYRWDSNDYPDYEQSGTEYYEEITSWLSMDEAGKQQLSEKLAGWFIASENTHSAAGFWGARNSLNESTVKDDGAEKAVIYLTDGEPNIYVGWANGLIGQYWGFHELFGSEQKALEKAKEQMAKLTGTDAKVYTIAYGDYEAESWLSVGVDGYFSADNTTELEEVLKRIAQSIKPSVSEVKNPVVTDQLSDNVEIYNGVTIEGITGPKLYLGEQELQVQTEYGKLVYYSGETKVAEYDPDSKTITWDVADSLGKEDTRTLSFAVRAIGDYQTDETLYTDIGDPETGTHAGANGYYSNGTAKLDFDGGSKDFPKPVVRPVQQTATIELKKEVIGAELEDWSFEFNATIGEQTENVTLKKGQPAKTWEVPIGTAYSIEEIGWTEDNPDYKITDTEWTVNDEAVETASGTVDTDTHVVCENTVGEYQRITVEKKIDDDGEVTTGTESYEFSITNNSGYSNTFSLAKDESTVLTIDPEIQGPFTITETGSQGAWNTVSEIKNGNSAKGGTTIGNVESGDEVTFTNYFYGHDIVLGKMIDGEEPSPGQMYSFTVKLKTEEDTALSEADISVIEDKEENPQNVTISGFEQVTDDSGYSYQFTVSLSADQPIRVDNLPKSVIGYEITENLEEINVDGYDVKIESVDIDNSNGTSDTHSSEGNKATVTYSENPMEDKEHKITFTNKYTAQLGRLQIEKKLTNGAASEDVSFVFKVTNAETKASFYVTVKVKQGSLKGDSDVFDVPVGTYDVSEVSSSIYYEPVGDSSKQVTVGPSDTTDTMIVKFENQRTGGGYFTDVSSVVNKVSESGFKPESDDDIQSMESALSKAGPFKKPEPVGEDEDGAEE